MSKRYLRPREVPAFYPIAKSTLDKWRGKGKGPRFTRVTDRNIAYDVEDLDAFFGGRKHQSTSEYQTPERRRRAG